MIQNPRSRSILFVCIALAAALLCQGNAEAGDWRYHATADPLGSGTLGGNPDDLPPGWVMMRMDPTGMMTPAVHDPDITFDPVIGQIRESYTEGGVETRPPTVSDLDAYSKLLTERTYRKLWRDGSRGSRSTQRGTAKKRPGLSYDLPIKLPKFARGILGDGAPNIDVSGSETITLSGVSDWTVKSQQAAQSEIKRPSAFPSLEMKQDLQVNLTGSIGDKIKVDVDQSSNVQTQLDNKVKLRYEGDEDDMIRSIDLGNTNLSLQGASIRQEGLFGVKTVAKLGNVDLVTIASKQEGKSETSRFTPSGEKREVKISDLDYIHRQYFLISDHALDYPHGSLQVFRDDRNPGNNPATGPKPGVARLDPTTDTTATNPQLTGDFDVLTQGTDYDVVFYYLPPAGEIPIIKMRYPMNLNDVLAVSYVEHTASGDVKVGDPDLASTDSLTVPGKRENMRVLKAIKPDASVPGTTADGTFDPTDPWYPILNFELRNFYDLTAKDIARETLTLHIRRRDNSQSVDPDELGGIPLIQMLGLDQQGPGGAGSRGRRGGRLRARAERPPRRRRDRHLVAPFPRGQRTCSRSSSHCALAGVRRLGRPDSGCTVADRQQLRSCCRRTGDRRGLE